MLYQCSLVEFVQKSTCSLVELTTCSLVDKPIAIFLYFFTYNRLFCFFQKIRF